MGKGKALKQLLLVRAAIALLLISSTACTTAPITEASRSAVRNGRIGVVSLQGGTFYRVYSGMTVFGNEGNSTTVPDWKIDELAARLLIQQLTTKGYTSSVPLSLNGIEPLSFYINDRPEKPSSDLDLTKLVALAADQNISTIVFISRTYGNSEDPIQNAVRGSYGEFRKNLFGVKLSCIYSMVEIALIDVATSKKIATTSTMPCSGGYDDLPLWKDAFDQYSDSEKELIRDILSKRVANQIEKAISDLKL